MSSLGAAWVLAGVQVTLLAVPAIGVYFLFARRRPDAGKLIALLVLTLSGILTLLAICPLPSWWTWRSWLENAAVKTTPATFRPTSESEATAPSIDANAPVSDKTLPPSPGKWTLPISWLQALQHRVPPAVVPSSKNGWPWQAWLACGLIAGTGVSLLRLLLGWLAARSLRRRAALIQEPAVLELLETLSREMECQRQIELCESAELRTPVAVGWRRLQILLPSDWRSWDDDERRAVLAHELAHIVHRDYLAILFSLVCLAFHFYHPLLRWLIHQLHLQQELAADAWSARLVGGRTVYLRILAGMALRQDGGPTGWLVRPFWSLSETLLTRRIQMLRVKDDGVRSLSWKGCLILTAGLGMAALAASGLRGFAENTLLREDAPKEQVKERKSDKHPDRPAFDLSYLPEDADCILALRPAVLFNQPGMDKLAWLIDMFIFKPTDLRVQDIEQVVMYGVAHPNQSSSYSISGLPVVEFGSGLATPVPAAPAVSVAPIASPKFEASSQRADGSGRQILVAPANTVPSTPTTPNTPASSATSSPTPPGVPPATETVSTSTQINGVLAGQVLDRFNHRPSGVHVQIIDLDDTRQPRPAPIEKSADDQGYFTIVGLRPGGHYQLIARVRDGDQFLTGTALAIPPNPRISIWLSKDTAQQAKPLSPIYPDKTDNDRHPPPPPPVAAIPFDEAPATISCPYMDLEVSLVRIAKDVDWEKILRSLHVKAKKMNYHGKTYWKGENLVSPTAPFPPPPPSANSAPPP